MITKDLEAKIVLHFTHGKLPVSIIAENLGIHHSVVRRVLQKSPETSYRQTRAKLIDPYVPFLLEQMEKYPKLKASRLYRMAVERGYSGAADHFRTEISKLRPEKKYEAFTKLIVSAGEQGQVDWAHFGKVKIGGSERSLSAFIMVLSWSRQIYVQFFLSMEMGCFLQGHADAFDFFDGVPRELLHDNLKSAVVERYESMVKFNEHYLRFASHYGFLPKACNVRRGNEKGRVERAVRYVRDNFFEGREFHDLGILNVQARHWCTEIAGSRRCISEPLYSVKEAFENEKAKLLRLPEDNYPIYTRDLVKVGKTHYARFDSNEYSVPGDYVRKELNVLATPYRVDFLFRDKVVASHARHWGKKEIILEPKHVDDILQHKSKLFYSKTLQNLLILLPEAKALLDRIAEQGGNMAYAAQDLHESLNSYGIETVTEALDVVLKKPKCTVVDIQIVSEKIRAKKGKKSPLILSPEVASKINALSDAKPDLAKYEYLGE
jgi:transposase